MKLDLIQKFEPANSVLSATSVDENTAVFLSYNDNDRYELLLVSNDDYKSVN